MFKQKKYRTGNASIIKSDYPDLDVIRVENTYYMVSTTMHFMPGCVILKSYNLIDWEFCSYVYQALDKTEGQCLLDNKGIYGRGMWAASLRFHNGIFYVSFVCNDTHKSYLFTSKSITGPWKKSEIKGFYHDMSLLFDDDGKIYIVSGNTDIHLTQMKEDLSGPEEGGVDKIIISDDRNQVNLGYEGSHFYKINGKYYIFMIHLPKGKMRTEACYVSEKIEGPYTGKDVLYADVENWNSGAAQGGIVDSPEGKYYAILFQDHGALGRIPVAVPVSFEKNFPVFGIDGEVPEKITVLDTKPFHKYKPLYGNDFTDKKGNLNFYWQWNHIPDLSLVSLKKKSLELTTDKICVNPVQAANTLTQRTFSERCEGSVTVDGSNLNDGDVAGFMALEGEYGFIGIRKEGTGLYITTAEHKIPYSTWTMNVYDDSKPDFKTALKTEKSRLDLKIKFDLTKENQNAEFFYKNEEKKFVSLGKCHLRYTLDQFVGVRFAFFVYSEKKSGGKAEFSNFKYTLW